MLNRDQILKDYFKLRWFLNRANKLTDQKSELRFSVRATRKGDFELWAEVVGIDESHGLVLAKREKTNRNEWERSGFSPGSAFESVCCEWLNTEPQTSDTALLEKRIYEGLRSLGL